MSSKILEIYKNMFHDKDYNLGQYGWMNGGLTPVNDNKILYAFCTVGNGHINENKKLETFSNVYDIYMFSGSPNITIIKKLDIFSYGKKDKKFVVGSSLFDSLLKSFYKNNEFLDMEEVLKLAKKDWKTFRNINTKNKYNLMFLDCMQQEFIKRLSYHKII